MTERAWTRIAVDVPEAAADALAARIGLAGFGVEIQDADTLARPEVGRTRLVMYAEPGKEAELLEQIWDELGLLDSRGVSIDGVRIHESATEESEWRDLWKRFWKPMKIGQHLYVCPSFEKAEPGDRLVITLDPGGAFGTGTHASTRLCLLAIDAALHSGRTVRSVLDVGTGSGILAIAAALAWPEAAIVATDNDPDALAVAAENAEKNRLGNRIELRADVPDAAFDLVIANIQLDAHLALVDVLAGAVAPGGNLVLAGLLTEQGAEAARAFGKRGLDWRANVVDAQDAMWCAEQLGRP